MAKSKFLLLSGIPTVEQMLELYERLTGHPATLEEAQEAAREFEKLQTTHDEDDFMFDRYEGEKDG